MPFYGTAILCTDDAAVRDIVPQVTCPITSYGFDEGAEVRLSMCARSMGKCTLPCSAAMAWCCRIWRWC